MGLVSDIPGALKELLRLVNNIFSRPSAQIKKVVRIYDSLHSIVDNTDVHRVLIVKAHNSGGLIKPHTPLYITALYEDYSHPMESIKGKWFKVEVDEEYVRILLQLCKERKVKFIVKDMKPSMLKDAYLSSGIKYGELHLLGQDGKNIYFCSVVSMWEDGWSRSISQTVAIDLAVNTIRNNII